MNKTEALAVLHEFHEAVKESVSISCVSLDTLQVTHVFTGGYQIKIRSELDGYSRDILKGIVKKYSLTMKEENGYVILQSREA